MTEFIVVQRQGEEVLMSKWIVIERSGWDKSLSFFDNEEDARREYELGLDPEHYVADEVYLVKIIQCQR